MPIVDEIKAIMRKHGAKGFAAVKVYDETIFVDLFDEYGCRKTEQILLCNLKYGALNFEECTAVAGAIKYRFGEDYVWERSTGNDDYDGSSFHDYYCAQVNHRNIEKLKTGGIKPF